MNQIIPQSNFLTINLPELEEVRLHYLTFGNPNNPPVFCVHGLSCNAYDFEYLARALSDEFYVIAPDIVGRGLSSHLNDKTKYTNDIALGLCLALLAHLKIVQPVHWVGASMGGIIGMMACFIQPSIIRSLMLNDVGAVLAKEGLAQIVQYLSAKLPIGDNAKFEAAYRAQNEENFGLQNDEYWQHFFASRTYTDIDGIVRLRGDFTVAKPLRDLILANEQPQDISLQALWLAVKCPTLIFRGENSSLLRHDDALAMQARDDISVELQEIKGCGHMPNLMEDSQIAAIHEWLKKQ